MREALFSLRGRTRAILAGPVRFPGLRPGAPPSATTAVSQASYTVTLYRCSRAQPLNSPAINGPDCGGLIHLYGWFGAAKESSPVSALSHVVHMGSASCPSGGSPTTTAVGLDTDVAATLRSCAQIGAVGACWRLGHWTFWLFGSPRLGIGWRGLADQLMSGARVMRLPQGPGLFEVDLGGDGEHSEDGWVLGSDVVDIANYHSAITALRSVSAHNVAWLLPRLKPWDSGAQAARIPTGRAGKPWEAGGRTRLAVARPVGSNGPESHAEGCGNPQPGVDFLFSTLQQAPTSPR
ncbi:MAG: hypothetical protein ACYCST_20895 [Acidimicrobiales bacterium]